MDKLWCTSNIVFHGQAMMHLQERRHEERHCDTAAAIWTLAWDDPKDFTLQKSRAENTRLYLKTNFEICGVLASPESDRCSHWNFNWFGILAGNELEEFIEGLHVLDSVMCKDVHKVRWNPSVINDTSSTFLNFGLKWVVCNSNWTTLIAWNLIESLNARQSFTLFEDNLSPASLHAQPPLCKAPICRKKKYHAKYMIFSWT